MPNQNLYFTDAAKRRWTDAYEAGRARAAEPACECEEVEDAGRLRQARMPDSNHLPGGGWNDQSDPDDFLHPEQSDPRNQTLRPDGRSAEYRGRAVDLPEYSGAYENLPSASVNRNAGELGTSVVSGPRVDRTEGIGLSGAPGYNSALNLSTTQSDPDVLWSTSSGGVGKLRNTGMGSGKASVADTIRRINSRNKSFYSTGSRDAGPDKKLSEEERAANASQVTPANQPEEGVQETRWQLSNPDGSVVEHIRRIHAPPSPTAAPVRTVDIMRPRYPAPLPRLNSEGGRFGKVVAARVSNGVSAIQELNRINREHYQRS